MWGIGCTDLLPQIIKSTSTRRPTFKEHLLNNTRRHTSKRAWKSLHNWAARKKRENKERNQDRTCASRRELWKRKRFLHTGKSPHWWDQLEQRGRNGASEESSATDVQRTKPRETWSPQPKMLVQSTTRAGGACVLRPGLWRSGPKDRTGVGCVKTVWRGYEVEHHNWWESKKKPGSFRDTRDHC